MGLPGCLAALLLRGPAHGYELKTTLEAELGPLWTTKTSQVYLTLGRMVRDGLITSRRLRQPTRPDRHLMALTGSGQDFARRWLYGPGERTEIPVRLAVGRVVAPRDFKPLADAIAQDRAATLRQLRRLRVDARDGFQREAIDAEIAQVQAELRWVTAIREEAEEISQRPPAPRRRAETIRSA